MKKSKAASKNSSKNTKKTVKPLAKVLSKVKALTKRATGMSAKTTKKPQTKAAKPAKEIKKPLPAKSAKAAATKSTGGKDLKKAAPVVAKSGPAEKPGKKGAKAPVMAAVLAKPAKAAEVVITKEAGKKGKAAKIPSNLNSERMCRENACENVATTKGYCRLDYIKNWKKIKRKEMILKEGKLNQYIEELVSKYPDKYIDVIRQDLSSEVNFNKVIHDLELDESIDDLEYDGDSIDALIGGIKKEDGGFDDTDF